MKIKTFIAIAAMSLMSFAGAVQAEEEAVTDDSAERPVHFAVGLKAWAMQWNTWGTVARYEASTAESSIAWLPTASLMYRDFVLSAGYLVSGYKDLRDSFGFGPYIKAKRNETDVSLGYRFLPGLTALIGYKKVDQSWDYTPLGGAGVAHYIYQGPLIGVAASSYLNNWLGIYGNFAYGRMTDKSKNSAGVAVSIAPDGLNYYSGETGLNFLIGGGFSATLAYKYQIIDTIDSPTNMVLQDVTKGFLLSATYAY